MADNQQSESEGEFESAESDSESLTPLNGTVSGLILYLVLRIYM